MNLAEGDLLGLLGGLLLHTEVLGRGIHDEAFLVVASHAVRIQGVAVRDVSRPVRVTHHHDFWLDFLRRDTDLRVVLL